MLYSEQIIDQAVKYTQLSDFGDSHFLRGFEILVNSINEEERPSRQAEVALTKEFHRVLVNLLYMQRDLIKHPEILDQDMAPPVFITSLPRTGSTKLHRMMAATNRFNTMAFWQTYAFSRADGGDTAIIARKKLAEEYLRWLEEKSPRFQTAHPKYVEEAEEETPLLDASFSSIFQWGAMLNVPSYIEYVFSVDGMQMFKDLKRMLLYLQWQHFPGSKRRWLLKSPSLFGQEAAFEATFPGTDFIVCLREPVRSIPSSCELGCAIRELFSDAVDPTMAGEMILYQLSQQAVAHCQWRQNTTHKGKVIEVGFKDIVGSESPLLEAVFSQLGLSYNVEDSRCVDGWLTLDATRNKQASAAKLADFGLSEEAVHAAFSDYSNYYKSYF